MSGADRLQGLADTLIAAFPQLAPTEQEMAIALLRMLARGAPASISRLAQTVGLDEAAVSETLDRWPGVFRDEHAQIVGFMGLTVIEMGDHRLHLDGRTVSAWCAWDTLFLPELLGVTASVTSRCPTTGQNISLTVTPDGATDLQPPETVVSFLVPETPFDAHVIQAFCHHVHFFAGPEAGASYTEQRPGTFLMSVDDAYALGQLTNRAAFGSAVVT